MYTQTKSNSLNNRKGKASMNTDQDTSFALITKEAKEWILVAVHREPAEDVAVYVRSIL